MGYLRGGIGGRNWNRNRKSTRRELAPTNDGVRNLPLGLWIVSMVVGNRAKGFQPLGVAKHPICYTFKSKKTKLKITSDEKIDTYTCCTNALWFIRL